MKQIDKIYDYILSNSKAFTKEKLLKIKGFSAQEVGEHLQMLRSNVSRELNTLVGKRKQLRLEIDLFCILIESNL